MATQRPTSFGKSLFFGDLNEELLFPYPQISGRELVETRNLVERIDALGRPGAANGIDAGRHDRAGGVPASVLFELRALGVFGIAVPTAYGGLGLSESAVCRVLDALGALDPALAVIVGVHSALLVRAILEFGSPEQKQRYLPGLAKGERIGALAVTEPMAGSDAAAIRTRADATPDGRFSLHGTKLWVQNGGLADLYLVFAQTQVVRDGSQLDRITGFLVERGPGVIPGAEQGKLGICGSSTTALYLDNVVVGRDEVLGTIGGGFKVLMETQTYGRLPFAAVCLGTTRTLLRLAVQHATTRRQFGRLISTLGMTKDKVAGTAIDLYAAESMVYLTAGLLDRKSRIDCSLETACGKVMASEVLWRAADDAVQIAGGAGYSRDYPFERLLRDARLFRIFPGGTNEVLRCYVALTGLAAPGEHLAKLADAIKFPLRGYGLVVDNLIDKVKVAAYGRSQLTGHHPRLKKEAVYIEDIAEQLAREVDRVLRRHGRQIHEMQYVQRRVADVVIGLYAMCAAVSRTSATLSDRDRNKPQWGRGLPEAAGQLEAAERELRLCSGFCYKENARIEKTLSRFSQNDDELMKSIADDCYHGSSYPFDPLL